MLSDCSREPNKARHALATWHSTRCLALHGMYCCITISHVSNTFVNACFTFCYTAATQPCMAIAPDCGSAAGKPCCPSEGALWRVGTNPPFDYRKAGCWAKGLTCKDTNWDAIYGPKQRAKGPFVWGTCVTASQP